MVSFYQMLPDRFRNLIDDYPQAIDDIWRWDCSLYDVSVQWACWYPGPTYLTMY